MTHKINLTGVMMPSQDGGYYGFIIEEPHLISQAETVEELRQKITEGYIATFEMKRDGFLNQKPENALYFDLPIAVNA